MREEKSSEIQVSAFYKHFGEKESVQIFTKGSILEPKSSFHNAMLYSTQLIDHEYSEVLILK